MSKPLKRGGHLLLACTSMYGICFLHPVIIPILRCPPVHCPSTISNILFSENAWPIKVKFYAELIDRGNESLFAASGSHDQDGRYAHYGKTLQKSSTPEPTDRFPRNLVCSIGDSTESISVCSNGDSGLTLTYFSARSKFCGKKSENI